ncbi:MAG: hypothetical protein N2253_03610 [Bacteroidia bacterium]|nr:hypothetical protein [Bacteroidia bacterium]
MIYGQFPFETQAIFFPGDSRLWVLFSPAAYIQGETYCFASYTLELTIREGNRIYAYHKRTFFLQSTSDETPTSNNLFSWRLLNIPSTASWEILLWDEIRRQAFFRSGTFVSGQWAVAFSQVGMGFVQGRLSQTLTVLYRLPTGLYLGQAALYKSASTLPELKQYLSIEERRFTLQGKDKWDTLKLHWRPEELPLGGYLIGLYLYRGEALLYQFLYSVRRK